MAAPLFIIKPTDALISPNLFLSRNSTCFGQFLCPSSGVFHCTFGTGVCHEGLMTAFRHVHPGCAWECLKAVIKPAWHILVPNVQWKTHDDGQHRNCPKHVEFLVKNTFGKSAGLLVLLKRNLLRSHERKMWQHLSIKCYPISERPLRCGRLPGFVRLSF